jgi:hypothetical protein
MPMRLGRLQRQSRRAFWASAAPEVSTSELAGWCWARQTLMEKRAPSRWQRESMILRGRLALCGQGASAANGCGGCRTPQRAGAESRLPPEEEMIVPPQCQSDSRRSPLLPHAPHPHGANRLRCPSLSEDVRPPRPFQPRPAPAIWLTPHRRDASRTTTRRR